MGVRPLGHRPTAACNWAQIAQVRRELGAGFVRILGYFREDGIKSVSAIEDAIRRRNAPALVIPAHTLKGEARQFGAERLSLMAEEIEMRSEERRVGKEGVSTFRTGRSPDH